MVQPGIRSCGGGILQLVVRGCAREAGPISEGGRYGSDMSSFPLCGLSVIQVPLMRALRLVRLVKKKTPSARRASSFAYCALQMNNHFNSRSPHGERQDNDCYPWSGLDFNSRSSCGERRSNALGVDFIKTLTPDIGSGAGIILFPSIRTLILSFQSSLSAGRVSPVSGGHGRVSLN